MRTEAQKKALNKYRRENLKIISFRLHNEREKNLIDTYETIPNKQEWFRESLREYAKRLLNDCTGETESYK